MVNRDRLIRTFFQLVQIDSESRNERKMADRVQQELTGIGCKVWEDKAGIEIKGNSGNIIAEYPGDIDYPVILLSAHLDRVDPGQGIKPGIVDGYIISKGETVLAADDLVGVVNILESLKIIDSEGIPHGPIKIVFTVAEELGLMGAKQLVPGVFDGVDYGIVYDAEGPVGTVVCKGPGKVKFNAIIKGKSAHAGMNPDKGVNAIKIASHAISDMQLGKLSDETTANIGVIKGGIASNIIPDLVELEGEVRSQNYNNLDIQVEHMKEVIQVYTDKYRGQVEFAIEPLYSCFSLDKESNIIRLVETAADRMDLSIRYLDSCGGSDANIFNQQGLPTVNLGIGVKNAHSTEERVEINNMVELVWLTINILKNSKGFKNV